MAYWYLDPINGNDGITPTPYGWWSVPYTSGNGTQPANVAAGAAGTACTKGASAAYICYCTLTSGTWAGGNAAGMMYFYGKTAAFTAGTVTIAGGSTFSIAGDFTYCAWQTITSGATSGRLTAGDVICIAKSRGSGIMSTIGSGSDTGQTAPVSLGNGAWTSVTVNRGGMPATLSITGAVSGSGGVIKLTVPTSTLTTGMVVQILNVSGTIEANGVWICTVIDSTHISLNGSVFVNTYSGSGGTCQNITSKSVVLDTAKTLQINNASYSGPTWTLQNGATVTPTKYTTDGKSGDGCVLIVKASPSNNTLYAYSPTGTLNLSGYQNVSFWIKNSTAILANQWQLALCSDTAGATPQNFIPIPAIPSTGQWVCLNIPYGGNLYNGIKSIALYSGSAAASTAGIFLNNIIACTSTGLNLTSVISTNSADQGGTEGWFGIQSIDPTGKIILLDMGTNTILNAGQGYFGTTQYAPTYKRETTPTPMAATNTAYVQSFQKSGTFTSGVVTFIDYEGGYDPHTNQQTGETFFDGQNGFGAGTYLSVGYNIVNYFSYFRYYYGTYMFGAACVGCNVPNISNANNCTNAGVYIYTPSFLTIGTIQNANNGSYYGISMTTANNLIITTIQNVNNNNRGIYVSAINCSIGAIVNASNNVQYNIVSGSNVIIGSMNCQYNSIHGVYNAGGTVLILNLTTNYNNVSIGPISGTLTVNTLTYGESPPFTAGTAFIASALYIENFNNTPNYRYFWSDYGYSTGVGGVWTSYVTGTQRNSTYPLPLPIATIYCQANVPVSITGTVQLSHATAITAAIVCPGGQIAGVPNTVMAQAAANTNAQILTLTFTPTASGPVTIYFNSWWVSGGTTYNATLQNIFTNSRLYGDVSLENTEGTLDFGQNYLLKYVMSANPYITQPNAATVAAYSEFSINHTTQTITISASTTLARLYDYTQYDLTQYPAIATYYSTLDGVNFVSSYNIVLNTGVGLTGGGSINVGVNTFTLTGTATYDGIIITSTNRIVHVKLIGTVSGSSYYIAKVSDGTVLISGTASDGQTDDLYTYTVDVPVVVKVRKSDYIPVSYNGTITSAGLSLNVSQAVDTIHA